MSVSILFKRKIKIKTGSKEEHYQMKDKSLELKQVEEVIVTQHGFNRKDQKVDVSCTIKVFSCICPHYVPYY